MPPSLLAFARLVIGAAILVPVARWTEPDGRPVGRGDAWRMVWMGVFGFAGASAFSHWGLARSTASNGALLIIVEPVAIMLLGPVVLGERLTRREAAGAALAVLGAAIVVINGVPGVTQTLAPHWRGDLLLVLSGLGYASYSLHRARRARASQRDLGDGPLHHVGRGRHGAAGGSSSGSRAAVRASGRAPSSGSSISAS